MNNKNFSEYSTGSSMSLANKKKLRNTTVLNENDIQGASLGGHPNSS